MPRWLALAVAMSYAAPAAAEDAGIAPAAAQGAGQVEKASATAPPAPVQPPSAAPLVPPEPSPQERVARTEFDAAQRNYDLGRFKVAIVHYTRAYEAMPLPAVLFNIAQCHRHLNQFSDAAFFYRRYLDLAKSPPNAALARELLAEMEDKAAKESEEKASAARIARALKEKSDANVETPLYRKWWVWAAAGGAVAVGATAAAVAVSAANAPTLGTVSGR